MVIPRLSSSAIMRQILVALSEMSFAKNIMYRRTWPKMMNSNDFGGHFPYDATIWSAFVELFG